MSHCLRGMANSELGVDRIDNGRDWFLDGELPSDPVAHRHFVKVITRRTHDQGCRYDYHCTTCPPHGFPGPAKHLSNQWDVLDRSHDWNVEHINPETDLTEVHERLGREQSRDNAASICKHQDTKQKGRVVYSRPCYSR